MRLMASATRTRRENRKAGTGKLEVCDGRLAIQPPVHGRTNY